MEMVVVTAIFSITVTVVVTILINSLTFQRRVKAEQVVIGAVRDAIETLAREIRLGYIDYQRHYEENLGSGALNLPIESDQSNGLNIITSSNEKFKFRLGGAQGDRLVGEDELLSEQPLSSSDIKINHLVFFVRPASDPYFVKSCNPDELPPASDCDGNSIPYPPLPPPFNCTTSGICELEDQQPTVTIVIQAELRDAGPDEFVTINLQTTVATRTYQR